MTFLLSFIQLRGGLPIVLAAAFFLLFLGIAYIVFRLLRRTVKMVFRIAVVAIILAVAVAGCVSLWALGKGSPKPPRQSRTR